MRKPSSPERPTMGLRDQAQQVEMILPNGATRPLLGTSHPDDQDVRANAATHSGGPRPTPRQQRQAAIELALPTRSQTILSHRLPRAQQERLNGGMQEPAASRRDEQDAERIQLIVPD